MPAEKVEIVTDNGITVKAMAPVIVSASGSVSNFVSALNS